MTGPRPIVPYLTDTTARPIAPVLDFRDRGALSYLGDFARNLPDYWGVAASTSNDPIYRFLGSKLMQIRGAVGSTSDSVEEEVRRKIAEARGAGGESMDIVRHDLSNMFGSIKNAFSDSELSFLDILKGAPGMLAELPRAITSPFEAASGIGLTEPNAPVLNPEERAAKIKETAGIIASTALGIGSRVGMQAYLGRHIPKSIASGAIAEPLDRVSDAALNLARTQTMGKVGRKLVTGFTEGAVAGVSYGAIGRANEEDQLATMMMGLVFAPIGAAFELMHKSKLDARVNAADALFTLRQMAFKPDESIYYRGKLFEELAKADDILMGVARAKLLSGENHVIIQGASHNLYRQTLYVPDLDELAVLAHRRADDTVDLLIRNIKEAETAMDYSVFAETGFIKNEVVSWAGKDWIVKEPDRDWMVLANPSSPHITVKARISELRRNPTVNIDNSQLIFQSERSLKRIWLDASKGGDSQIFTRSNETALTYAETGKPVTFVGFRQQRGKEIGTAKANVQFRFYALDPTHAGGYSGGKWKGFTQEELDIIKSKKVSDSSNYYVSPVSLPSGELIWQDATNKTGRLKTVGRRTAAGPAESLIIHRLDFENPFVFKGKHREFVRSVINEFEADIPLSPDETLLIKATSFENYKTLHKKLHGVEPITNEGWYNRMRAEVSKRARISPLFKLFTDKEKQALKAASQVTYGYNKKGLHPESGYQLMDTIISNAMARNGYDGWLLVDKGGDISNTEVVSLKKAHIGQSSSKITKGQTTGYIPNIVDAEKFVDLLYDEFLPTISRADNQVPFDEAFTSFAKAKGFIDNELPALKLSFEKRLSKDLLNMIPEEDRIRLQTVQNEISQIQLNKWDALARNVETNGMYFDTASDGVIKVRDRTTNAILKETQDIDEANEFVNRSGQADGPNLDGNSPIPPSLINGNIPPGGGSAPFHQGMVPDSPTRAEQFISNIMPAWFTRNRENFRNLDVIHNLGGRLAKVFDDMDSARRVKIAGEQPFLERFQTIHRMLEGSADAEAKIPVWMEMMTSSERRMKGARGGKAMNADEINLAHVLAGEKDDLVDIDKLYKFIERRRKLQKDGLNGKQLNKQQRQVEYDKMKQELAFTPREDTALQALIMARRLPLDQLETGAAVRLAETLQAEWKGMITDRNAYAAKHFTPKQMAAAKLTEQLYKDLADVFGISKDTLLQGYFPHARTKFDGNLSRTLREFNLPQKEKEFFARMVRTGEIRPHESNLTPATLRYISAGFNEMHMKKAVNDAIETFKNEILPKIPDAADRKQAKAIFTAYTDAVVGKPHVWDQNVNAAVKRMMKVIGVEVVEDSRAMQNIVNSMMMSITSATQGLRVALAIRDLYTGLRSYGVKLMSVNKAAEAFKYGFDMDNAAVRKALMDTGETAHYGILQFSGTETESAIRNIASKAGQKLSDAQVKMLKLGGQPTIYERLAAGFTIERKKSVMEEARKYLAGGLKEEDLKKVYKNLRLDSYDHNVAVNFDKIFQAGDYEGAAKYLARQTVAETLGWYGQGNHPKGWNNYLGRVAGQFGNWSINYRDSILRAASAGPIADRVARLGVMGIFDGALTLAAAKIGISFTSWMTLPAMVFAGGPSLDYVQAANDAMFGFGREKDLAQSKLKRLLPYDADNDEWRLNQFYLPGGYFANDIAKAMEINEEMGGGYAALRGAGFRVEESYYQPGFIENYFKENVVDPIEY